MKKDSDSKHLQRKSLKENLNTKDKDCWSTGFIIFSVEGKTYKGQVVKVADFKTDSSTFSCSVSGIVEEANYHDK